MWNTFSNQIKTCTASPFLCRMFLYQEPMTSRAPVLVLSVCFSLLYQTSSDRRFSIRLKMRWLRQTFANQSMLRGCMLILFAHIWFKAFKKKTWSKIYFPNQVSILVHLNFFTLIYHPMENWWALMPCSWWVVQHEGNLRQHGSWGSVVYLIEFLSLFPARSPESTHRCGLAADFLSDHDPLRWTLSCQIYTSFREITKRGALLHGVPYGVPKMEYP